MKYDKVLKLAYYFEKLAQETDPGNEFWNSPLAPNYQYSFAVSSEALFTIFNKVGRDLEDPDSSQGPVYQLKNMIAAGKVPDGNAFMTLVNQIASIANGLPATDPNFNDARQLSRYLVGYAQALVNKYINPQQAKTDQTPQSDQDQGGGQPQATESPAKLLSRVYAQLRAGQQLSDTDQQKVQFAKSFYQRRLNGLNGLAQRTPAQEQERGVLHFVLGKVWDGSQETSQTIQAPDSSSK